MYYLPSVKHVRTILKNNSDICRICEGNKAESPWSARFRVFHNNTIYHLSISREISLQVILRCLPRQTTNKKFSAQKYTQSPTDISNLFQLISKILLSLRSRPFFHGLLTIFNINYRAIYRNISIYKKYACFEYTIIWNTL